MRKIISAALLICMILSCVLPLSVSADNSDPSLITFDDEVRACFISLNSTTVSIVADDTEAGHSALFEIKSPYTDPYVYFNYSSYLKKRGIDASAAPAAETVKYVILKVKQEFCSNNMFEVFYCSRGGATVPTGGYSVVSSFDEGDDGWQYIAMNMSSCKGWSGAISGFRIDWMLNGTGDGEKMWINQIILAKSDEEAAQYLRGGDGTGEDLHALTSEQQKVAEYLMANAVDPAPKVSNMPLEAEDEDEELEMWFDHSYYKTPGETVRSNGKNTYQMRLARNESESAQMVLASPTAKTGLTVECSDFVNGSSKITPKILYGYYFDNVDGQSIVDPVPELRGPIDLAANRSQMFLIKITAPKDAAPGQYQATLTVKDSGGKEIKKANVYAYVWDFELPDASNVKTLADLGWFNLYAMDNVNGTLYGDDNGCKCGEDLLEYHFHSGTTYKAYYDLLLENKINAYNMPFVEEAQYTDGDDFDRQTIIDYLNDPRVQAFNPIGFAKAPNGSNIGRARDFLKQNPSWAEKAYFYTVDEPMNKNDLDKVNSHGDLIRDVWGDDYKLIVPMHLNGLYDREYKVDAFAYVESAVNVWCAHTFFFNTYADKQADPRLTYRGMKKVEENLGTFPERMAQAQENGEEVWWYVTRYPHYPEITLSINDPAVDHRILFWQQKLYNVDGFLYYSVNDWFQKASEGTWGWDAKKEVSTDSYTPYTVYGNGVLVYHGGKIGRIHEPVASIRLEHIRDGIEDYDYFAMLDEKYGEGTSDLLIKQVTTSLGNFKSDIDLFTKVRLAAGNLLAGEKLDLEEAALDEIFHDDFEEEHDPADWKTAGGPKVEDGVLTLGIPAGAWTTTGYQAYVDSRKVDYTKPYVVEFKATVSSFGSCYTGFGIRGADYKDENNNNSYANFNNGGRWQIPNASESANGIPIDLYVSKAAQYMGLVFADGGAQGSAPYAFFTIPEGFDVHKEHTYKLSDFGDTIKFSIDGELFFTIELSELVDGKYTYANVVDRNGDCQYEGKVSVNQYGYFGFYQRDCGITVDDVSIRGTSGMPFDVTGAAFDSLVYDGKALVSEKAYLYVNDAANKDDINFKESRVKEITFTGWAQIDGEIKGFGYTLDGGELVTGDFVIDRAAELESAGFPGAQGYSVTVPVDGLKVGSHRIVIYVVNAEDEYVPVVKVKDGESYPVQLVFDVLENKGVAGDINGDGAINNKDVALLFRFVSAPVSQYVDETAADCNGDGNVNNKDVVLLFRFVSGSDVTIVYGPQPEEPELPASAYYTYGKIKVVKPEGYTFKEFAGLPSGLKDGMAEGTCFFNFSVQPHGEEMNEQSAAAFLEALAPTIGADYTNDGFKSYTTKDGLKVTKLDFTWGNGGAITQSLVKVYFDDGDVVIQFANQPLVFPAGSLEFDEMIESMRKA